MTREEAVNIMSQMIKDEEGFLSDNTVEAHKMAIKALEQEPCKDVSDINDGNIYECSCGYGWDKSKVVRHHFCPNCGRAVEPSYNSIKTELKPCDDAVSRQAAVEAFQMFREYESNCSNEGWVNRIETVLNQLPPVNPQPKMGRWIYGEDNLGTGRDGWYCNQCGHFEFWDYSMDMKSAKLILPNPCPNCGAKMVELQAEKE